MNTFTGANLEFQNRGIHFMLAELVKFRKQLTVRSEFNAQSGWTNSLNNYLVEELEKLNKTLATLTYNPDDKHKDEVEKDAADSTKTLADEFNSRALTADNVLLPALAPIKIVWDLSGADLDLPQVTPTSMPNDMGRTFITGLDELFVMLTRLDSRKANTQLTKQESSMVKAHLNMLYTICQLKGGEANKSDVPTGTLPSEEAATFNHATK